MIISSNSKPTLNEFEVLVSRANSLLNEDAKRRPSYYITRSGTKLEEDVLSKMKQASIGTKFEGTIELVSGQKFPDIIAHKYYGVEVKSTKGDHWATTGNSVLESTRVDGIERIHIIFGKLGGEIEFLSRPYEECLNEVVVTHYPRYKIDMKLPIGETIFDKMDMEYKDIRKLENPVEPLAEYYQKQLKEGESLWWMNSGTEVPYKVRLWSSLDTNEKEEYRMKGFVYFPEVFSSYSKKYYNFILWLVTRFGIVSTSTRDIYSAGGRVNLEINGTVFENIPRIFFHLYDYSELIYRELYEADMELLKYHWKVDSIEENRLDQWIQLVLENNSIDSFNIKEFLNQIFDS